MNKNLLTIVCADRDKAVVKVKEDITPLEAAMNPLCNPEHAYYTIFNIGSTRQFKITNRDSSTFTVNRNTCVTESFSALMNHVLDFVYEETGYRF